MAVPAKGETLRGYLLNSDFKMAGGGTCKWTFATKDSKEFFVKVFLQPKKPKPDGLGSEETKAKLREACARFEKHQRELMEAVRKLVGTGGRLVAPIEFFEHDGQYYKIAHKVSVSPGAETEITTRPIKDRLNLCINVATALQSLHKAKIVHGDLKMENILIEKSADGGYTARVIDFDSSYIMGDPPIADEILGDPPYYSPELLDYIQGRVGPEKLTTASDIFSLGIVFTRYLTGNRPMWSDTTHNYLAEAVRAGASPTIEPMKNPEGREGSLRSLILQMLSLDPSARPDLFTLKQELVKIRDAGDTTGGVKRTETTEAKPDIKDSSSEDSRTGRLRIIGFPKKDEPAKEPEVSVDSETREVTADGIDEPAISVATDSPDVPLLVEPEGDHGEESVPAETPPTELTDTTTPPVPTPEVPAANVADMANHAIELLNKIASAAAEPATPASRLRGDLAKSSPPSSGYSDTLADSLRDIVARLSEIAPKG